MRERLQWQHAGRQPDPVTEAAAGVLDRDAEVDDPAALEASLVAADLMICQTGCLSHGEYWRVQDHCKRTGKACVLVEAPQALRIVRIQRPAEGDGASIAPMVAEPAG
ncbi:DUF2325 domain-containing protein [Chitinimonas koreensis]|uniref:DUF2325 domain-containing protein n=1 Tax=Chitinimonas koreensis TaxID=356302 RepID=UPI0003FC16CE|nr:DUF2325 domain-containing protein [Chitinimonas koreensis]